MAWTTPGTAVAGAVLEADFWNSNVRDNTLELYSDVQDLNNTVRRIAYVERTSDFTSTATSIATATDIFASDITFTADGTSRYLVEFYTPLLRQPAVNDSYASVVLTDGGNTGRGTMALISVTNGDSARATILARSFIQFSAGSTTLNLRLVVSSGTGTIVSGNGGTGITSWFPSYLAVYGPPLT
jgi:hypothetical protein